MRKKGFTLIELLVVISIYYDYEPDCNQGKCPSPSGCCYYTITARLESGGSHILKGGSY